MINLGNINVRLHLGNLVVGLLHLLFSLNLRLKLGNFSTGQFNFVV